MIFWLLRGGVTWGINTEPPTNLPSDDPVQVLFGEEEKQLAVRSQPELGLWAALQRRQQTGAEEEEGQRGHGVRHQQPVLHKQRYHAAKKDKLSNNHAFSWRTTHLASLNHCKPHMTCRKWIYFNVTLPKSIPSAFHPVAVHTQRGKMVLAFQPSSSWFSEGARTRTTVDSHNRTSPPLVKTYVSTTKLSFWF